MPYNLRAANLFRTWCSTRQWSDPLCYNHNKHASQHAFHFASIQPNQKEDSNHVVNLKLAIHVVLDSFK